MQTDTTSHNIVSPTIYVGSCWHLLALVARCMQTNATTANIVVVSSLFWPLNSSPFYSKLFLCLEVFSHFFLKLFGTSQRQDFSLRIISCFTSWFDHLLVHLLAFFEFLPKRLMFSHILRSTQLDTPCLQQSRRRVRRRFHETNIVVIP